MTTSTTDLQRRTAPPDDVGPVDVALILFPSGELDREVAPAIVDLHRSGTVRVLDMAFVTNSGVGTTVVEVEDSPFAEAFAGIDPAQELDLLSDADLSSVSDVLEPGHGVLVVVWENVWATRLATSIRRSSGLVLSWTRIPHDDVVDAVTSAQQGE